MAQINLQVPESLENSINIYNNLTNDLLLKVQKPGQYLGIEHGHLIKNNFSDQSLKELKSWDNTKVRTAIIYPETYELGMSNFGTKILYQIINDKYEFLCDRAYAPMKDMEEHLKKNKISLWGWESFMPLNQFDLIGFSLSYELSYTNVLNIIELSGLDPIANKRKETFPLIFAGGPATFNPEPMADFIDFFIIGDGEEVIIEILNIINDYKENTVGVAKDKKELLLKLTNIPGVYVPRFYEADACENFIPKPINKQVPNKIVKRVVNLSSSNQPVSGPVPYLASIQDRQVLEIRRGCDRGCRFCQPGYVYLPVRERTLDELVKISTQALENTGYDEYSLLSLSASDYTCLHETAVKLNNAHAQKGVSLSMPSQRADRFDMKIANEINAIRKSGITLAPEAGTERLREVINKGLKEKDIKRAVENVYDSEFHRVKLYFMIGLPTETLEDLDGIINILKWAYDLSKIKNKKPLEITCTISTFVPKPFTPFQWFNQNTTLEFQDKINYLKNKVKENRLRTVKLNCTNPNTALLEAVLSRGDRRMSKLIYLAYKNGATFDSWDEYLNIQNWTHTAQTLGIDLHYEATKNRPVGSVNPWDIIDTGLLNKFLIEEYNNAIKVKETSPCTENTCHACGVCFELDVFNEVTIDKSNNNKFVKEIETDIIATANKADSNGQNNNSFRKFNLPTKTTKRVEIIHTKTGDLRFISHLDIQRLFERALRRANIQFAFTEGYNPRPKMQWLMPLPIYYESKYELIHLDLASDITDLEVQITLNSHLPPEFQVISVKSVNSGCKFEDLNNIKILYRILTYKPNLWEKYICETKTAIESFLSQDSVILKVLKKQKTLLQNTDKTLEKEVNIRILVEEIKFLNENKPEFEVKVKGNARAEHIVNHIAQNVFPQEIIEKDLDGLHLWQSNWKICKEMVYIKN